MDGYPNTTLAKGLARLLSGTRRLLPDDEHAPHPLPENPLPTTDPRPKTTFELEWVDRSVLPSTRGIKIITLETIPENVIVAFDPASPCSAVRVDLPRPRHADPVAGKDCPW